VKIYHIVHVDKFAAILSTGSLLCDAELHRIRIEGTSTGMEKNKTSFQQKLLRLKL
jgi:hypothetical protein